MGADGTQEGCREQEKKQKKDGEGDPQKQKGKLSKEDAERLLEMAKDQERKARENQRKAAEESKDKDGKGVKDW